MCSQLASNVMHHCQVSDPENNAGEAGKHTLGAHAVIGIQPDTLFGGHGSPLDGNGETVAVTFLPVVHGVLRLHRMALVTH
jgi:hypothetical protein